MTAPAAKSAVIDLSRWLWPVACLAVLAGYFGAWVGHPAAGLVITGVDLGEYVKFLQPVTNGELSIWRQGFYAPLLAVSLACGLLAYRSTYAYPFWLRMTLVLVGLVAALNMLPPAWSPAVLRAPEFRLQTIAIALSVAVLAFSPLLALVPPLPVYLLLATLSLAGAWLPASGFLRALPAIAEVYHRILRPGWGFYVNIVALMLLVAACWLGYRREAGGA